MMVDVDIRERLVRLETKMDVLLEKEEARLTRENNRELRITALEIWRARIYGAVAVLSLFAGSMGAWVTKQFLP